MNSTVYYPPTDTISPASHTLSDLSHSFYIPFLVSYLIAKISSDDETAKLRSHKTPILEP
jgi:hypothetical protein